MPDSIIIFLSVFERIVKKKNRIINPKHQFLYFVSKHWYQLDNVTGWRVVSEQLNCAWTWWRCPLSPLWLNITLDSLVHQTRESYYRHLVREFDSLPQHLAIHLLDIYPADLKIYVQVNTCMCMLIATLFIIGRKTDTTKIFFSWWMNEPCYIYTMKYYLVLTLEEPHVFTQEEPWYPGLEETWNICTLIFIAKLWLLINNWARISA